MRHNLAMLFFGFFVGANLIYTAWMAGTGEPIFGTILFMVNLFTLIVMIKNILMHERLDRIMEARYRALEALMEIRETLERWKEIARVEDESARIE
jgi:uncharacterized membrane protein